MLEVTHIKKADAGHFRDLRKLGNAQCTPHELYNMMSANDKKNGLNMLRNHFRSNIDGVPDMSKKIIPGLSIVNFGFFFLIEHLALKYAVAIPHKKYP